MAMRAVTAAIILLTIGAGRAAAQDLSPQGKAAGAAYVQCLRHGARLADDGTSEPGAIALKVVDLCRASIGEYAAVGSHGSFDIRANPNGMEQRAVADATEAVLMMRKRAERRRARKAYLARIWHAATGHAR